MKYLLVALIFLHVGLGADGFDFEVLRAQEKQNALKAFKKLHKKRKHIHASMRSSLAYVRSKSLHKNSLSFFQAKTRLGRDGQVMELSNAFVSGVVSKSPSVADETTIDSSEPLSTETNLEPTTTLDMPNSSDEGVVVESSEPTAENIDESSDIRGGVVSPWSRR